MMDTIAGQRTSVLVDILSELLAIGACIASGRDTKDLGNPEHIRSRIHTMFMAAEDQSKSRGVEVGVFEQAKFAVAAFLDEKIMSTSWGQQAHQAADKRFQYRYFQSTLAGSEFFERLEKIRRASPRNTDLLEVYALCLTLGFSGKYGDYEQEQLSRLIEEVTEDVQPKRGAQSILSPHGQRPQEWIDAAQRGLSVWAVCVIGVAIPLLVYSVLEYFMQGQVTDLLDRLMRIRSGAD